MTAIEAHWHAMEEARRTHSLREVQGHAYPIPEGEMQRWIAYEAEQRAHRQRMRLRRNPRVALEALFR